MSDSRRVFLLGAGTMAGEHARAATASGQQIEVHAADPSEEAQANFKKHIPDATLYPDVEAMLAVPAEDGDLAVVATPLAAPTPHRARRTLGPAHPLRETAPAVL